MSNKYKNLIYIGPFLIILFGSVYLLTNLAPKFFTSISPNTEVKERVVAPNFGPLSDFLGKRVILIFWTSWNDVSLNQLQIIDDYYRSIPNEDIAVLAVSTGEDAKAVEAVLAKKSISARVLLDTDGAVGEAYGVGFLPLTVFIDRAGLEASRIVGPMTLEEIKAQLNQL